MWLLLGGARCAPDAIQQISAFEHASMIDDEVRLLVNSQYERAKALLTERREELEVLANELLEKEVLLKSDVERLIGPRPNQESSEGESSGANETVLQNGIE